MDVVPRNPHSKHAIQSLVAFCFSTVVHLIGILALGMILIGSQGEDGNALFSLAIVAEDATTEDVTQLTVSVELPEVVATASDVNVSIPSISSTFDPQQLLADSGIGDVGSTSLGTSDLVGAEVGKKIESNTSTSKTGLRASFFGAEADGNRFVFVIDSSGSMRGSRWTALCKELVRAIKSLSPDQEFFVISFDATAHPMFGLAPPSGKFLKANKKSIERVQNWIRSIEHGRNTFPSSAVGIAMKLRPDAIFLLSDGEINDSTVSDLRIWNRFTDEQGYEKTLVPIHTVLLHSEVGYATLETIANENSGTFTPVKAR